MGSGFSGQGHAVGCLQRGELEEFEGAFLVRVGLGIALEGRQLRSCPRFIRELRLDPVAAGICIDSILQIVVM